ncbi:uncharacterized protein M421DRAFT_415414 [Didymella exigua CBS 183.55]|uniref:PH domain-containing protein n=1 Tax=Didymella exigua CBS 183.55 TaxID=1150837 RepID=A0A6A5S157_9PLEO|nr:uncharacterized protein M421DRAFT_415414 [Didymella exigua CBS 183.55]KAF1934381.1 hypothetical protein M421DRAFT_415414 [Didymella exigua CBS 183.55]
MSGSTAPATRRQRPSNQQTSAVYGYHNTFHTHAQLPLGSPPAYARIDDNLRYLNNKARTEAKAERADVQPPPYSCTVEIGGVLGVRHELLSPYHVSGQRDWSDCYVILRGTQLSIHRVKQPGLWSKTKGLTAGRLISSYTLQHAEVGIASDFKRTAIIPKSPFAHLVPASARHKLYETDPHLFEPVREHVIRIRVETEQLLLCTTSQELMLDWVEAFCAAIDISSPLEDRSEPRYRSLPRRNRRQRILDGAQLGEDLDNLSSLDAGRRIIAEQERIIRHLYPHLGGGLPMGNVTTVTATGDPFDEFDPEDVRFPTRNGLPHSSSQDDEEEPPSTASSDSKNGSVIRPTPSEALRYRRRCAPVLLSSSPRVSDVVICDGKRMRIHIKERTLVDYTSHPPRYDAHGFKKKRSPKPTTIEIEAPATIVVEKIHGSERPASPIRAASDDSIASITFGYDLAPTHSEQDADRIDLASSSGPPSPIAMSQTKMDATRQLGHMGKIRTSIDGRNNEISAVALGVGLLI